MKRSLILFTLLASLLAPQLAHAIPFFGGVTISDDDYTLSENLQLLTASYGAIFTNAAESASVTDVIGIDKDYFYAGIGYSQEARRANLTLTSSDELFTGNARTGYRPSQEYASGELTFSYLNLITNRNEKMPLSDMLSGTGIDSIIINEVYRLENDAAISLGGGDALALDAGTLFFSFSIPGSGNVVDFIMTAYLPSSAVPAPAAVWLLGSGLAGLMALRRKLRTDGQKQNTSWHS